MPKTKAQHIFILALVILFFSVCTGSGAFMLAEARCHKAQIASDIIKGEREVYRLKRLNEELLTKISTKQSPEELRQIRQTSKSNLEQPKFGMVVWGYENFEGGRVENGNKKSDVMISFRSPKETPAKKL